MRVGFGYDSHRLKKGEGMFLGGVFIKSKFSIVAHSDGDIIIHSLIDSLLGAAALGDIGTLFPSNKSEYQDISSQLLLNEVVKMINSNQYKIINVDVSLISQEPKLNSYIEKIRTKLSSLLNIDMGYVSCKATTTDGLGFEGKKEGISCACISLIENL